MQYWKSPFNSRTYVDLRLLPPIARYFEHLFSERFDGKHAVGANEEQFFS
jgi:hypothetical protein